jgi:hypothetical protein
VLLGYSEHVGVKVTLIVKPLISKGIFIRIVEASPHCSGVKDVTFVVLLPSNLVDYLVPAETVTLIHP